MTTLAVAIGNLDLHTKNLGLMHPDDGSVRLAPSYDMVPQAHDEGDGRLALAVNGEYRHSLLTAEDLLEESSSWGVRRAETIVGEDLEHIAKIVDKESPLPHAHPALHDDIRRFVANLRSGMAIGSHP